MATPTTPYGFKHGNEEDRAVCARDFVLRGVVARQPATRSVARSTTAVGVGEVSGRQRRGIQIVEIEAGRESR